MGSMLYSREQVKSGQVVGISPKCNCQSLQIISNILRYSLQNVCHDKLLLIICYNVYLNDFFNTFRPTPPCEHMNIKTNVISYFISPSNLLLSLLTLTSIPLGHFIGCIYMTN